PTIVRNRGNISFVQASSSLLRPKSKGKAKRKRMIRRSFLVLVAAAVPFVAVDGLAQAPAPAQPAAPIVPQAAPQPANVLTDVVNKVQAFYDKTQSFQSDFTQEFTVKAYNQKKSSKGAVTFSKPGKMDWVYEDPKDNRVVSDGETLK